MLKRTLNGFILFTFKITYCLTLLSKILKKCHLRHFCNPFGHFFNVFHRVEKVVKLLPLCGQATLGHARERGDCTVCPKKKNLKKTLFKVNYTHFQLLYGILSKNSLLKRWKGKIAMTLVFLYFLSMKVGIFRQSELAVMA